MNEVPIYIAAWISLPLLIRSILIIISVALISKPVIKYAIPYLLIALAKILMVIVSLLGGMLITLMSFMLKKKLQEGGPPPSSIVHLESVVEKTVEFCNWTVSQLSKKNKENQRSRFNSYYRKVWVTAVAIVLLSLYFLPNSILSAKWASLDTWIIENPLDSGHLSQETARLILEDKLDGASKSVDAALEENTSIFVLIDSVDGGNLRMDATVQSESIAIINPEEELVYSGESKQNEDGVTWYYVRNESGKVGWISGTIVREK
ncbi:hypothetical protein JOC95_000355 [Bacillus tianshenii]|uniref:SH3b domain-containing protein n=1 Tax=Sutcliffiella tianshenii TaxID=1463404 RepID=A0ABS2NV27_9BACI|nr:SH3 domain-containing protein [Bacillus tianshenii]MBM7618513.1 hypothetical protein [Bacillus tianshenii]